MLQGLKVSVCLCVFIFLFQTATTWPRLGGCLLTTCFPHKTVAIPVTLIKRSKEIYSKKIVTAYKGDIIAYYLFDYLVCFFFFFFADSVWKANLGVFGSEVFFAAVFEFCFGMYFLNLTSTDHHRSYTFDRGSFFFF